MIPGSRKIPLRKKWQSTPVFSPGKSNGQRSLSGYSPWGYKRVRQDLATKLQQQSGLWIEKKQEERTSSHMQSHPLSYKDFQAPLSMGFARQEYWSELPFRSPEGGIFQTQGSNPRLLHCKQLLYHGSHQGSPLLLYNIIILMIIYFLTT